VQAAPLRRNRDFNILWSGQVLSDLGTRASGVALPLLVLAVTGSPARAGITGFVESLPILLLTLPVGALVDRWNRKLVMIVADSARCGAFVSLVVALLLERISFVQILLVALVDGTGFVFFSISERAALPHVVPDEQLPAALARNQAREYAALLAGTPLGGVLFGLGRTVPFFANAGSYFVSVVSLLFIRSRLEGTRIAPRRHLVAEVRDGIAWLWHQPFLRTTSLLVTGSDFTLNALYLVVIVVARDRGASSALIGAMFAFLGAGGILGAVAAPTLARRVPTRFVVIGTMWLEAALVPVLLVVPGALPVGVVYGAMFFLHPTWNAVVGAYRLRLTPDELRGRVVSVATILSLGSVPFALLGVGFLLETAGSTPTILILAGLMALVAATAAASSAVRHPPELRGA
jgi:hypothetical protein